MSSWSASRWSVCRRSSGASVLRMDTRAAVLKLLAEEIAEAIERAADWLTAVVQ